MLRDGRGRAKASAATRMLTVCMGGVGVWMGKVPRERQKRVRGARNYRCTVCACAILIGLARTAIRVFCTRPR